MPLLPGYSGLGEADSENRALGGHGGLGLSGVMQRCSHEGRSGLGQDGRGLWSPGSTCYVPMDLPPLSCVSVLDNDQPTKLPPSTQCLH